MPRFSAEWVRDKQVPAFRIYEYALEKRRIPLRGAPFGFGWRKRGRYWAAGFFAAVLVAGLGAEAVSARA